MQKLRTAIIGCGKVAQLHAQALVDAPNSQFVACCSRDLGRAQKFAANYGVQAFDNVTQMIESCDVQAVLVCTPHPSHAAPTVEAARAGAHVLTEKPLASSLQDCDAMIEAARQNNVQLGCMSQRRFYPPCQRIRQAIDDGKLGTPSLCAVTLYGWRGEEYYNSDAWRGSWEHEGGGVLVNQAPHGLDLMRWFMGPIAEISGYHANLNHPYIEVEDSAVAIVRFVSGALGTITISNSQNPPLWGRVSVHGSNGASVGVQTDGGLMFIAGVSEIEEPPLNDLWTIEGESGMLENWQNEDRALFKSVKATEHFHRLQIEEFLSAVSENRAPAVTGQDGRDVVEIFTGVYRSQRDGCSVKFPLSAENDRSDYDGRLSA